jgi:hypothetical protein
MDNRECNNFEKDKIKMLNKFFMKNILVGSITAVAMFIITVIMLIVIVKVTSIDDALKISIISMVATFIITTSKTIIEKSIGIVSFLVRLLSEEQRGLNNNIGIEIDKVDLDEVDIDE